MNIDNLKTPFDASILALYKEMKSKAPNQEDVDAIIAEVKKYYFIGDPVTIRLTSHKGKIVGYNESLGIEDGVRYPIAVKILESDFPNAVGQVFNYSVDFVIKTDIGDTNVV